MRGISEITDDMKNYFSAFSVLCTIALCVCAAGSPLQAQRRTSEQDRAALIALENEWLANEHNAAALERILASDFVHPLPTGDFVTKEQHIAFSSAHPPPPTQKQRFDQIQVRVYGDVGIVNGVVVTTDDKGRTGGPSGTGGDQEVNRTVFTDVFVWRDGRWQAVNAQENAVGKR
jgi:hypothetical protein